MYFLIFRLKPLLILLIGCTYFVLMIFKDIIIVVRRWFWCLVSVRMLVCLQHDLGVVGVCTIRSWGRTMLVAAECGFACSGAIAKRQGLFSDFNGVLMVCPFTSPLLSPPASFTKLKNALIGSRSLNNL